MCGEGGGGGGCVGVCVCGRGGGGGGGRGLKSPCSHRSLVQQVLMPVPFDPHTCSSAAISYSMCGIHELLSQGCQLWADRVISECRVNAIIDRVEYPVSFDRVGKLRERVILVGEIKREDYLSGGN